jgi:hypothetical protein
MKVVDQSLNDIASVDETVESSLQLLSEKLSRPHIIDEFDKDLAVLDSLVYSLKRKGEMLEKMLDKNTPEVERRQILEVLTVHYADVAGGAAELEQLRDKTHTLLEMSAPLIAKAQRRIDEQAHNHSGYALETCGLCGGLKSKTHNRCPACKDKGAVLVRRPPLKV